MLPFIVHLLSAVFIALAPNSHTPFQRPGICNYCVICLHSPELLLWRYSRCYGPNATEEKKSQVEKAHRSTVGQQYLLSSY